MPPAAAVQVEEFSPLQLKDALVLLAFPTTGQAASIAGQYLTRHLDLPLVGHVRVADLQSVVSVQDGVATSAVRIFGGEVACRLGKNCPRIFLVMTELALAPPLIARLGESLVAWTKQGGAQMLLAMEGVVRAPGDETPDVYCAASDPGVLKELKGTGIPIMERALIAGIAARALLLGPQAGMPVGALLVEASRDHPDGRAAAALLEALGKIVPDVQMDFQPLLKEAMELEAEIKRAQEPAAHLGQIPESQSFI